MSAVIFPLFTMLAIAAASVLTDTLLSGALQGLFAGALAGAIVVPALNQPDSAGRGLFFGVMSAIAVALYALVFMVLPVTGNTAGSAINGSVGAALLDAGVYVTAAFFIGTVVGFLSLVPGDVIKGALMGLFMGAVSGAILLVLLNQFNIGLSGFFFQGLVGLMVGALLLSITGGADEQQMVKRKKKKKDPWK